MFVIRYRLKQLLEIFIIISTMLFSGYFYYQYHYGRLLFENSNFEFGDLTNWHVEGTAFHSQPLKGDEIWKRAKQLSYHRDNYWIGTYESKIDGIPSSDFHTGSLTSQEFVINSNKIHFLVGGGNGTDNTSAQLWIEGVLVLKKIAIGQILETESMIPVVWNVSAWRSKTAKIIIIDHAVGRWGHINVDDFHYF